MSPRSCSGHKREGDDGTLARLTPPQCGERAVHPSNEVGCLPGEVEPASIQQVLEGKDVISKYRELMGATNPENADENTIRKLYGVSVEENSVHGSDSEDNSKIEIEFFFPKREIFNIYLKYMYIGISI